MIWNSKIKFGMKKKKSGKSNILAVGDERVSPPVRPQEGAEESAEVLSESTCFFLRRMRETGTAAASLMSQGSARYKHGTRTQMQKCQREQTHIYTRRDCGARGEARFQSASKRHRGESPYFRLGIYRKSRHLHKTEKNFKRLDFPRAPPG